MNSNSSPPSRSESGRACQSCGAPLGSRSTTAVCPRCALNQMLALEGDPGLANSGAGSAGRAFGEYQLHGEIGRGGMGAIYKARHARLNRWVALKVMAGGEFASADFKQRFRTEAEAAAALDHPNIIPIYEVGEADGQPYFSMKLVEGGTLTSWRWPKERETRLRAIAEAVASLARAVHYAHERGVLHRDLKPNNVLVDGSGTLFLTDFGLAKLLEKESTLTKTLAVMGTPSYMAPEQARGETRQLTTGADVYGLGAILYELLAGRPPFTGGSSLEILRQVLEEEPVPPSRVSNPGDSRGRSEVYSSSRDLDTICLKCLEKEPARRYASAAALADDLQRWLRHEPILARQASTVERLQKWIRRRPAWAALIATIAVSLLALGVGSALFTAQVIRARTKTEEVNRELSRNLFIREWQDAEGLVEQDKAAGALAWFARALRQHSDDVALATRLLSLLSEHAFPLPRGHPITNDVTLRTVALSPDDQRLVSADVAGRVRCWSVESGKELFALPRTFDQPGAAFVADNEAIVVVDRAAVSRWPADGGPAPLREVPSQNVNTFDLSADGRRLALSWRDRKAEVWDAAALRRISECALGDVENPNFLRLNCDGSLLLRSRQSELRVFESATGRLLWRAQPSLDPADWFYAKADFTGDNARAVGFHMAGVVRGQFSVWPLDLEAGSAASPVRQVKPKLSAPIQAESSGILVNRDSTRAYIWSRSGLLNCYSIETGARMMQPVEHDGAVVSVAEAASSDWIATACERTAQFWDLGMRTPVP